MTPLAKATLTAEYSSGVVEVLEVQYNPAEFSLDKGVQLAEIAIPGLDSPLLQFVRGQNEKLSLDLFFDTTDDGTGAGATSVTTKTDPIYSLVKIEPAGHAPPIVTFAWNAAFPGADLPAASGNQRRNTFRGVVESCRQKFTFFSPEGVPLRATLSLSLREYKTLDDQLAQLNLSSPDRTHAHLTREGDTLSRIAARYYGRASEWRAIATENDIDDPRRLDPGVLLDSAFDPVRTMAIPTLADESRAQHGFYVPQFEIRIEGVGLPRDVLRDVSQVTYRDSLKEIDGFELTVNNWDPRTRQFRYVGFETAADLTGSDDRAQRARLFDPCNKEVELRAGYLGDLRTLMRGTFTSLEPTFPSGGAPTLAVRALNALHKLRRKQISHTWESLRDSQIAEKIGEDRQRFPLPIVVSDEAREKELPLPYIAQTQQYDIDFLLLRAKRLGYVVVIREGDAKATDPRRRTTHLYFGPSDGRRPGATDPLYRLRWGASLVEFKPTLTTANQIKSVTVNGWDRKKKEVITGKASLDDEALAINKDLHHLLKECDPREEIVVEQPVYSKDEADRRAMAILKDRHKEMVKASAACVGLPSLMAGTKVEIEGVGARFSGVYFITATTHSFGDSGYTTRFDARREVTGSLEGLQ